MPLSLKEAAQRVGVNKTTLLRQIKSGRLSASRTEAGSWTIDAAELFRVHELKPGGAGDARHASGHAAVQESAAQRGVQQDAAGPAAAGAVDAAAVETRIAAARLEVENAALKTLVAHLTAERDRWCEQAQRLALTDQTKPGAPVTVPSVAPRRPWWRRLTR